MILAEQELQQALIQTETAFPNFSDWKHNNDESYEDYCGFAVWGIYTYNPDDDDSSRDFYITFDICEEKWAGHLSIGQHCYFWSSADFGDAVLADTEPCDTLEDAIAALKDEMVKLLRAFSAI